MINNQIKNFHDSLVNQINQSGLPIAMVYYILQDIYREVENTMYASLNEELASQEQEENETQEEE